MSIGGRNLININFANLGNQVKFIDNLNYYQQSLAQITSTITLGEKLAVKKVVTQLICQHGYFRQV